MRPDAPRCAPMLLQRSNLQAQPSRHQPFATLLSLSIVSPNGFLSLTSGPPNPLRSTFYTCQPTRSQKVPGTLALGMKHMQPVPQQGHAARSAGAEWAAARSPRHGGSPGCRGGSPRSPCGSPYIPVRDAADGPLLRVGEPDLIDHGSNQRASRLLYRRLPFFLRRTSQMAMAMARLLLASCVAG